MNWRCDFCPIIISMPITTKYFGEKVIIQKETFENYDLGMEKQNIREISFLREFFWLTSWILINARKKCRPWNSNDLELTTLTFQTVFQGHTCHFSLFLKFLLFLSPGLRWAWAQVARWCFRICLSVISYHFISHWNPQQISTILPQRSFSKDQYVGQSAYLEDGGISAH